MSEYFLVYICIWALALTHSLMQADTNDRIFKIQGIILVALAALRFETGYDWPVYGAHYRKDALGDAFVFEPGYELLVSFFVHAGVNFNHYLSIISIFMIVVMMYIFKKIIPEHKEIALAVAFSVPEFFLIPVFSVIRQTISLLILLLGYVVLKNGQRRSGLVLIFSSFLFHYSTVFIFFIVILFRRLNLNDRAYWRIFAGSSLFYIIGFDAFGYLLKFIVELIIPAYGYYVGKDTFNASFMYRVVVVIASAIIFKLVMSSRMQTDGEAGVRSLFGKNSALLSLLLPILVFNFPTLTSRFLFFGAFFIATYSLRGLTSRLHLTRTLICTVLSLMLVLPFYRFLSSPFSLPYVPYQSMLSYDERTSTGGERTQELLDMLDSLW